MSFEDTINQTAKKSLFWNAHLVLDKFSETGDPRSAGSIDGGLTVEQAALRIISLSARDTYRLDRKALSSFSRQNGLADEEVVVASITMGRNDIGLPPGHSKETPADKIKPLRFEVDDKNRFTFTSVNDGGDPQYDRATWEAERLAHLDTCLDQGANIICLGEFDFPPEQHGVDQSIFEAEILKRINGRPFPVFVLAGSRHEFNDTAGTCKNVARVIVNDLLKDTAPGRTPQNVFMHDKIVPATKVGEVLSPPSTIEAKYYDTKLGRIAVLICVDAYNPTLMFSLIDPKLYKRTGSLHGEPDRLDFILVPSYNFSPKLYYSCQVLSMMCNCTVLLVDACSNWTGAKELRREESELFFNGRSFSDRRNQDDEIGERKLNEDRVKVWSLKKNFLRAAEAEKRGDSPTPSFDALRDFLQDNGDS